ncbi:hypothetical protein KKC08_04110 [Patescibacteria group bacterium]|nr:hypothetical protein [Patescibacteria group bacterium]MCG2702307.1 hypothetical protein [Candidatus Parcubacteria bacterium]MBU4264586.1 hypothetical protein [Patescibacteria group bacterium]MBU4390254.1 hypothetical protein [Patescibacteria group bacterium]MBU4397324.1 hypothetical protein [Patescibacteria group bacterium]
MKTIDDLCRELKLNEKQRQAIKNYLTFFVIDMLESLREENTTNFDETIKELRGIR